MKRVTAFLCVLLLVACGVVQAADNLKSELTLGVFAYRPKPVMQARYQPLVDYLNTQLKETHVKLQVLELAELEEAIAHNELDLVFTNPRHFILLRSQNKLTGAIATLIKKGSGGLATPYLGGVIFTRAGEVDIAQLADLEGRSIAIPGTKFLGGYQCQAYEILQAGLEIPTKNLIEVGQHDKVVEAVLAGKADVGFVRTEVLEDLSRDGRLDLGQIKVINGKFIHGYPFMASTELYPEWPVVALPHVDRRQVSRIASILLALEAGHPAAQAAGIAGFTPPADYLPVENITRALRLPPFDRAPDFTWRDVVEQHKTAVVIVLLSLFIIMVLMLLLLRRNRFITEQREALRKSEERYDLAMSVVNDGIWDWDLASDSVHFDDRYYTMAGYRPGEFPCTFAEWEGRVHPDEVQQILLAIAQHLRGESDRFDVEFRFRRKDGEYMWIRGQGKIVARDEKGQARRFIGTHADITEQKRAKLAQQESQRKYQRLVDDIGDKFVIFSHTGTTGLLTYVSDGIFPIFGLRKEEVLGRHWGESIQWLPEDAASAQAYADQQMAGEVDFLEFEMRFIGPDEQLRTIRVSQHPVRDGAGNLLAIEGIVEDVTEHRAAQEQLRLAASVFAHSQEGIVITDANNRIVDVNPACLELTGYTAEEVIGSNPNMFSSGTQSAQFYADMWHSLIHSGHWQGEVWNRKKSGEIYSERLSIDAVYNEKGVVQHYVAVFYDITHLKEHAAELERIAYNDALTGLPNRLLLRDRMRQAIHQAERHETMVAICYLDLDGFKPINDTYGHKVGDQVLIEVAERLDKSVRSGDTVARLGGDEFVLLLLELHNISQLEEILERILYAVSQSYELAQASVTVSASIGIALYPFDEAEADILLRHADQAMYVAKRQGKSRYSFFDASDEQRAVIAHSMQQEIGEALSRQEFRLYYQPKVNMRTGEVVGVEALIRWQHPQKGLLAPGSFLRVVESSAIITQLGNWVLREALSQLRVWQSEGIELAVSVNIAAQQFQQAEFVSSLRGLLAEFSDISAARLELEILESTALHDIGHVSQIMQECISMGVRFALDDFGTGYSSLTYLKRLPAAVLKIDQSFIRNLLNDLDDLTITEGILGLAHAFRRTPIAEGVETVEHGTMLLNLGCELAQGYGIAHPMPAHEVRAWIKDFRIPAQWQHAGGASLLDSDFAILVMAVEHHRLVEKVLSAANRRVPALIPDHFHDPHACEFGKWLDSEGRKRFGKRPEFAEIVTKHRRVHELIQRIANMTSTGDSEALASVITELKEMRNSVLESLNQLRGKAA